MHVNTAHPSSLWRSAPPWMRVAAVFLLAVPAGEFLLGAIPDASAANASAFAVRMLIEGGAFWWASRTAHLERRVRVVLLSLGVISIVSALSDAMMAAGIAAGGAHVPESALVAVTLASYVCSLVQLGLPLAALNRGERSVFALDMLVTIGGISALLWVLVTHPLQAASVSAVPRSLLLAYGVGQIVQLAGPAVLLTRGLGYPSRRALGLFIAGQAAYVPVLLLAQYHEGGLPIDPRVIDVLYFGSVICTLLAAVAYRTDTPDAAPTRIVPAYGLINPFVLATPLLVAAALLVALHLGADVQVAPLADLLAATTLLLVVRTWRSERERARLTEAEMTEAARLAALKNAALSRLAGGIAHEFNNLMQVVIGHADLAAVGAPLRSPLLADLSQIRTAAERAALLTSQLLHFSGRQVKRQHRLDLSESVSAARLTELLPADVAVDLELSRVPTIHADPVQIRQLITELVSNAGDAMPRGGRLGIFVSSTHLEGPIPGAVLLVPPGHYVVIDVRDTGPGIPPDVVTQVFEPFYSTKGEKGRAGLGLAAVYGIVASHRGGIAVEAGPTGGTRVRVFFPVADVAAQSAAAS